MLYVIKAAMTKTLKKPELLLPAGSKETLKAAVLYGADSVYMGTPDMSMRTSSKLSLKDVVDCTCFAHENSKKVYLTLNIFSHNKDVSKLPEYVETIREVSPDGILVADPGVFDYLKENAPEFNLHISTQANTCSWLTVDYWKKQGASLVVLGREVSFREIAEIREKCPNIRLEAFVHGAMCMTYSGRCLLSNFMAERGANQGNCANSCRWNYRVHLKLKDGSIKDLELDEANSEIFEFLLEEGYRPGDLLPVTEDSRGSYILNSKDLCLMPRLNDYLRIGMDVLKIEGRGRSPYYVAMTARTYRRAIDDWFENPEKWDSRAYMRELYTISGRGYTLAFHEGRLTNYAHSYEGNSPAGEWEYAGIIDEVTDDSLIVVPKNKLEAGDVLEFILAGTPETYLLRLYGFNTANGSKSKVIHAGDKQKVIIPFSAFEHEDQEKIKLHLTPMTVIRKEKAITETERLRIAGDRAALRLEQGKGSERVYLDNREKLQKELEKESAGRRTRSPRLGTEGCCGRGCNGCHIFWNDPSYEKARELLAKKKQGEMLNRCKTSDLI